MFCLSKPLRSIGFSVESEIPLNLVLRGVRAIALSINYYITIKLNLLILYFVVFSIHRSILENYLEVATTAVVMSGSGGTIPRTSIYLDNFHIVVLEEYWALERK